MATHDYQKGTEGKTVGGGQTATFTTGEFSVPAGEKIKRFKIIQLVNNSNIVTRAISGQSLKPSWNTWFTDANLIGWKDGGAAKICVHNDAESGISFRAAVIFQTEDLPYTEVTKGNKIKATDRSQTGTATLQGAVMKDSHFSAGTKITASAFNEKVLGM